MHIDTLDFWRAFSATYSNGHAHSVSPSSLICSTQAVKPVTFYIAPRHPDKEHLGSKHFRIARKATGKSKAASEPNKSPDVGGLKQLCGVFENCVFPPTKIGLRAGLLSRLQRAQTQLVACYLLAALEVTKRRTPKNPDGVVQIHPVAKLPRLTASKAADLFKHLLGQLHDKLDADLHTTNQKSFHLRPKNTKILSL